MGIACPFPFGLSPNVFFLILAFLSFSFDKKKRLSFYMLLGTVFYFPCSTSGPPPPGDPFPHITPARKFKNACPVPPDDIPCPCVRIAPVPTKDPRNPVETQFGVNRILVAGRGGERAGKKWIEATYRISKR